MRCFGWSVVSWRLLGLYSGPCVPPLWGLVSATRTTDRNQSSCSCLQKSVNCSLISEWALWSPACWSVLEKTLNSNQWMAAPSCVNRWMRSVVKCFVCSLSAVHYSLWRSWVTCGDVGSGALCLLCVDSGSVLDEYPSIHQCWYTLSEPHEYTL